MSNEHSPEPWSIKRHVEKPTKVPVTVAPSGWYQDEQLNIFDANGESLQSDPYDGMNDEDMTRIVACVNACQGILTETLAKIQFFPDVPQQSEPAEILCRDFLQSRGYVVI